MKKVIFLSFILVCLFLGCNNTSSDNKKANSKENKMSKAAKKDAVCSVLTRELESLIANNDSIDKGSAISGNVYIVFFFSKETDCYVTIYQSLCYYQSFYPKTLSSPSYDMEGFILLKNKMVAFYNLASGCNKGLVDITKLEKGSPKDFPDESSDLAIHTTYDPWGKKYKIHSRDSLELVYSGSF